MEQAVRLGDSFDGQVPCHCPAGTPPVTLTGTVIEGSSNVFINGQPVVVLGDATSEVDSCVHPQPGIGEITTGSSKVFVNGKPKVKKGDSILTHVGVSLSFNKDYSQNVLIGG